MNHSQFNRYKSFSSKDFASDNDFVRYICNPGPDDIVFWQQFLANFPEKKHAVREAGLLIQAFQPDIAQIPPTDEADLWAILSEKHDDFFKTKHNFVWGQRIKKVFLVTTIVLSLIMALTFFSDRNSDIYTYHTGFDQVATVILPDSSIVKLNANSTVKVWTSGFLEKKREVILSGEAHFEVKKRALFGKYQKMLVHTNSGTVEVIGTIFNVYSRGNKTKVYLREGGVKINNMPDLPVILLNPGDYIQYDKLEKTIYKKKVVPEVIDSWTTNKLIFEKTTLQEVFNHIREIHGWGYVIMNHSLLEKTFTGVLPANDLDLLLKALEEVFDMDIKKKDKTLVVTLK